MTREDAVGEKRDAAGGDPRSPAALVDRYFRDVYLACFRVLGHPQDAEDATQETFLALSRDRRGAEFAESPRAWILTVARNVSVSMGRRRRRGVPLDDAVVPAPADLIPEAPDRDRLNDALAQLGERDRALLEMRLVRGIEPVGIARELGMEPGAVRTAVHRAIVRLRGLYGVNR